MSRLPQRPERHFVDRIGWLRSSGARGNDGILSTASLIVGVAGGRSDAECRLDAGVAGLVAGAMVLMAPANMCGQFAIRFRTRGPRARADGN